MLPDEPTVWQAVGSAIGSAARGMAWLVTTGSKHSHYLAPALNGAIGDKLAAWQHRLAIPMSLRRDGRDIDPGSLAPSTSGHVALYVHGLMADEVCFFEPLPGLVGPAPHLQRELGLEPLLVRFNSGRHISDNGRLLADLIEAAVDQLGDSLETLSLIGHSMGGLVTQSAIYYGRQARHAWLERVRDVVLLGTPNDGAWLEQVSHLTTTVLRSIFNLHTQLIARLIDERSAGIKDLRYGALVESDWRDGQRRKTRVPALDAARYIVAGASLSADPESLLAAFFGDGQVGVPSSMGARSMTPRRLTRQVFEGTSHFGLLGDSALKCWLTEALSSAE